VVHSQVWIKGGVLFLLPSPASNFYYEANNTILAEEPNLPQLLRRPVVNVHQHLDASQDLHLCEHIPRWWPTRAPTRRHDIALPQQHRRGWRRTTEPWVREEGVALGLPRLVELPADRRLPSANSRYDAHTIIYECTWTFLSLPLN
jgi:hypothetical protein